MKIQERRAAYASLWVLAIAFGWIEACVVVYLREIYLRDFPVQTSTLAGLEVTLVSLPASLLTLEVAREACTIVLLAAVGWLAGRRRADRAGAFLLAFGIWDLTYYAALRLALGWPRNLSAWDVLFLIPSPWVAPVWAPVTVAILFVAAGSYLFWTSDRERHYRWTDAAVLMASAALTVAAFLMGSNAAVDHRVPEHFPVWLFWTGLALGAAWFLRVERGVVRGREPWVGVRVRTVAPTQTGLAAPRSGAVVHTSEPPDQPAAADVEQVAREYAEHRRRLDALVREASELGERFERLSHGLSMHPGRMIIGLPDQALENPSEWDIVPPHPLPSIDHLIALTNGIRAAKVAVEELRERLILMGRGDAVEQPDEFFR